MINLLYGLDSYSIDCAILQRLEQNRLEKDSSHIIIVPDRFSVTIEKQMFDMLNIDSCCDIDILTLSRLAQKVIGRKKVLDKTTATLLVQKIILENQDKFLCFGKALKDSSFATTIYETINQLKSCQISPDSLVQNLSGELKEKLADISLIYNEYEKCLTEGVIDSNQRLDLLRQEIKDSEFLKNSHIYISHFENFTSQGYAVIEELFKHCKSVSLAVVESDNVINGHIYLNDVREKVLAICRKLDIQPQIIPCESVMKNQFKYLQNNLFSYRTRPITLNEKTNTISVWEGGDVLDEVRLCATNIKKAIVSDGLRYKDITVAVAGLETYESIIARVFEEFGISYFMDTSYKLSDNFAVRFLNNCFELLLNGYSHRLVFSLIKNVILGFGIEKTANFEDYALKFNIDNLNLFEHIDYEKDSEEFVDFSYIRDLFLTRYNVFAENCKVAKTASDFVVATRELLKVFNVEQRLVDVEENFLKTLNEKQARIVGQVWEKIDYVLQSILDTLGNVELTASGFYDVLKSGIESVKISLIPLQIDGVFVGDVSTSFFERTKYMFVLGCTQGSFPSQKQDVGLISDTEIDTLKDSYKIEPTIQVLNQRERFKVFTTVLLPTEKLFLSYSLKSIGGAGQTKSSVVEQIQKMFVHFDRNNVLQPIDTYQRDYNLNTFVENLATYDNAKRYLVNGLRYIYDGSRFCQEDDYVELYNYFKTKGDEPDLKLLNFDNSTYRIDEKIFFKEGRFGVSEIEGFMVCPFRHYLQYGLKLKERDLGELDKMNVGNILHAVAKEFNQKNKLPIDDDKVPAIAKTIFDNVLKAEVYERILKNNANKIQILNLQKEAVQFCLAINYQAKHSAFKTDWKFNEVFFSEDGKISSLKFSCGGREIVLVGAIDRIDVYNEYFRIIDYKTGKSDNNFKELFYGKKIQLYIYQNVVQKGIKLKPAGVYYFPVKNEFAEEGKTVSTIYTLKGYTVDKEEVVLASDDQLKENMASDIIEVKKNKPGKNGEMVFSKHSKLLGEKFIQAMGEYAVKLMKQACDDIDSGEISPKPLQLFGNDFCQRCKYVGICRFDLDLKNKKRCPNYDITVDAFVKEEDKDE